MIKKSILSAILFLCILPSIFAWSARGHMIIAAIAYSELSQADRDSAVSLLLHHPYYKDIWKQAYVGHETKVEFGTFMFMKASLWADEIKRSGSLNHNLNDNTTHYITYKVQFPDKHDTTMVIEKKKSNVVLKIEEAKKDLNNKNLSKEKRAIALSWIIHLIGDIHMPMHCGSLFNENVPEGDKGGNLSFIFWGNSGTGIHKIWDGALGKTRQYDVVVDTATVINKKYSELASNNNYNPLSWSIESFKIAVEYGYLNGDLQIAYKKEDAVLPPKDYLSNMREVSDKQAVIAGHRLSQFVTDLNLSNNFYKTESKN